MDKQNANVSSFDSFELREKAASSFAAKECRLVLDRYLRVCTRLRSYIPEGTTLDEASRFTRKFAESLSAPCLDSAKDLFWKERQEQWARFRDHSTPLCTEAAYRAAGQWCDAANGAARASKAATFQAEAIVARQLQKPDMAALLAKFQGREDALVLKLREKFSDTTTDKLPENLVAVESSIAYKSDSFVGAAAGVFVHVWTSNAEAKRFMTAFQRAWQAVYDVRLPGVAVPFSGLVSSQTTYVTATSLVALSESDGYPSPYAGSVRRALDERAQSFGAPGAVALRSGQDDQMLYVADPMGFLVDKTGREAATTAADGHDFARVELWHRRVEGIDPAKTPALEERTAAAVKSAARVLFGEAEARRQGRTNPLDIVDSLVQSEVPRKALHQCGVNLHDMFAVHEQLARVPGDVSRIATVALEHDMVARTVKELLRATLWDSRTYASLVLTSRADVDAHRAKTVASRLHSLVVKGTGWAERLMPILRRKFGAPDGFTIDRASVVIKVLFSLSCRYVGAAFNAEAKRIDPPLKSFAAMGTTFITPYKAYISSGASPPTFAEHDGSPVAVVVSFVDRATFGGPNKVFAALEALLSPLGDSELGIELVAARSCALRALVAAVGNSRERPDGAAAALLKQLVLLQLAAMAQMPPNSDASTLTAFADLPGATRLLKDKVLMKRCRSDFAQLAHNSVEHLSSIPRLPSAIGNAYLDALPMLTVDDSLLVPVQLSACQQFSRLLHEVPAMRVVTAQVELLGASHASVDSTSDSLVAAWRKFSLATCQRAKKQLGEKTSLTLMATSYWAFFVLLDVANASRKGEIQATEESTGSLNADDQASVSAYREVFGRLHAADEKGRRKLLGSDHFMSCTARFAGVLMANGEWVAGRALAAVCGKMLSWNPALAPSTVELVTGVCSRMADARLAARTLQGVLQRRKNRSGIGRAVFGEAVHRRGVELVAHWSQQQVDAARFAHYRVVAKQRLTGVLGRIHCMCFEEALARSAIEASWIVRTPLMVLECQEMTARLRTAEAYTCAVSIVHVQVQERVQRHGTTRAALGFLQDGWSAWQSSERRRLEEAEGHSKFELSVAELSDFCSLSREAVWHRESVELRECISDSESATRQFILTSEARSRISFAEVCNRSAIELQEVPHIAASLVGLESSSRAELQAREDLRWSRLWSEFLANTQQHNVESLGVVEEVERAELQSSWVTMRIQHFSAFGVSLCTAMAREILRDAADKLEPRFRGAICSTEAADRARLECAITAELETSCRATVVALRWSGIGNLLYMQSLHRRQQVEDFRNQKLRSVLAGSFEALSRRALVAAFLHEHPQWSQVQGAVQPEARLEAHEAMARSVLRAAEASAVVKVLSVSEALQRRSILKKEAAERIPPWVVRTSLLESYEKASRRRIETDDFVFRVAVLADHAFRMIDATAPCLLRAAASAKTPLLIEAEALRKRLILSREQIEWQRIAQRQEQLWRASLTKERDTELLDASIPFTVHVEASRLWKEAQASALHLVWEQRLSFMHMNVSAWKTAVREDWITCALGVRYRIAFDEEVAWTHLERCMYCEDTAVRLMTHIASACVALLAADVAAGRATAKEIADREFTYPGVQRQRRKHQRYLAVVEAVEEEQRRSMVREEFRRRQAVLLRHRDVLSVDAHLTTRVASGRDCAPCLLPPLRLRDRAVELAQLVEQEDDQRLRLQLACTAERRRIVVAFKQRKRAGTAPPSVLSSARSSSAVSTVSRDVGAKVVVREHRGLGLLRRVRSEADAVLGELGRDDSVCTHVGRAVSAVLEIVQSQRAMSFTRHAQVETGHSALADEGPQRRHIEQAQHSERRAAMKAFNARLQAMAVATRVKEQQPKLRR